jgi:RecJ-like exonuclease
MKMENKCQCKLCGDILKGLDNYILYCKCNEICLDGINKLVVCNTCDDNYIELKDELIEDISNKPSKKELLDMLDEMVKNIENLPSNAMYTPINHYDLMSVLLLLSSILRSG